MKPFYMILSLVGVLNLTCAKIDRKSLQVTATSEKIIVLIEGIAKRGFCSEEAALLRATYANHVLQGDEILNQLLKLETKVHEDKVEKHARQKQREDKIMFCVTILSVVFLTAFFTAAAVNPR